MIKSVQFRNFKVLRDATLPLSRFTLIVGPNGSGKSTALQALLAVKNPPSYSVVVTAGLTPTEAAVEVVIQWEASHEGALSTAAWSPTRDFFLRHQGSDERDLDAKLSKVRVYALEAHAIAAPVQLNPQMELAQNGGFLAGVLDHLRDQDPERFDALNDELGRWFPEFDKILFDTPGTGQRLFLLRTRKGHHKIPAADLSQGTLLALAILTLGYLPDPPSLVGLEEPDRGIHPRLLRQIQDALYRLSYPENFGEKHEPVQVIATTHSPYLLDLYRDHPEEIVIAHKSNEGARFERLSERPDIEEILEDAPLGDVWYSGILGGVPAEQ
jgi:predicted ATPase